MAMGGWTPVRSPPVRGNGAKGMAILLMVGTFLESLVERVSGFLAGQGARVVEDFLHLPGQAVGLVNAANLRLAVAGAQDARELAVAVEPFIVEFHDIDVM